MAHFSPKYICYIVSIVNISFSPTSDRGTYWKDCTSEALREKKKKALTVQPTLTTSTETNGDTNKLNVNLS